METCGIIGRKAENFLVVFLGPRSWGCRTKVGTKAAAVVAACFLALSCSPRSFLVSAPKGREEEGEVLQKMRPRERKEKEPKEE